MATKFCELCGAPTMYKCPHCNEEIEGYKKGDYVGSIGYGTPVPDFCHNCGKPYPWTINKLKASNKNPDKITNHDAIDIKEIHDDIYKVNGLKQYEYDIAISYAGEEKEIAQQIAEKLRENGINVFYDGFYEDELWGKDLTTFFERVFKEKARYCLMLISQNYLNKNWPTQEKQYTLSRQLEEHEEYILPVKFDIVNVPGLPNTIGYKKFTTVEDITNLLTKKIKGNHKISNISTSSKITTNHRIT